MVLFIAGLVYGILTICAFMYILLLVLGCYHQTHLELPENDTVDALLWLIDSLGMARVGAYILLALLWPILLLSILALYFVTKKYESRESIPKKLLKKIDWFFLGFGKFVQAK